MAKPNKMSTADLEFFTRVARATFSNPFGEERRELDQQILGVASPLSPEKLVDAVASKVGERLQALHDARKANLRLYAGSERKIVRNVFLFHVYHRFRADFDNFILEQKRQGDTPSPVPFAREAIGMLAALGFTDDDALRLFAFFYQVRRAFYFINNNLIGRSPSMRKLRMHLWNHVFTHNVSWYEQYLWNRMEDFSTMLLGETGTGKGAAASAIGRSGFIPFDLPKNAFSESFTRNFISLNLSQYQEALIESELFGHKKGAFTGAIDNHDGVFSRCTPHGSIFLDEIGDVSVPVQIKLLQILQGRTFSPVGSHAKLRFHGRVIAATNRPLDELRQQGLFRDDFYYRLCSDIIVVPTLRQRIQEDASELNLLVANILERMIGEAPTELREMLREVLQQDLGKDYPWPGNVRELEQAVRRILLTRHYHGDLNSGTAGLREQLILGIDSGSLDAQGVLQRYCQFLYARHQTYEEVARRTNLDRRTVKKYIKFS